MLRRRSSRDDEEIEIIKEVAIDQKRGRERKIILATRISGERQALVIFHKIGKLVIVEVWRVFRKGGSEIVSLSLSLLDLLKLSEVVARVSVNRVGLKENLLVIAVAEKIFVVFTQTDKVL